MVLSVKNVVPDMLESILVRLDVKDLIRGKNVCKLWRSFISSNRFVNAHLRYRYDADRNNNNFNLRRIYMTSKLDSYTGFPDINYRTSLNACNIVGSYNGLVCIAASDSVRILVVNPSTRQFKILPNPDIKNHPYFHPYMGFGYDSSSDDYKVVLGEINGFHVFSLKTNVWRYIGKLHHRYCYITGKIQLGTLCNGAIHWLMHEPKDGTTKALIISFDLSTEEFKEIPQPDYDGDYKLNPFCTLGIINEGLCIFHQYFDDYPIWVMKSYKLKESWTLIPAYCHIPPDQRVNDAIHTLKELKDDCIPHMGFFTSHDMIHLRFEHVYICFPIYVQSLVSPHVCRRLKRKREPNNNRKVHYKKKGLQ